MRLMLSFLVGATILGGCVGDDYYPIPDSGADGGDPVDAGSDGTSGQDTGLDAIGLPDPDSSTGADSGADSNADSSADSTIDVVDASVADSSDASTSDVSDAAVEACTPECVEDSGEQILCGPAYNGCGNCGPDDGGCMGSKSCEVFTPSDGGISTVECLCPIIDPDC